MTVHRIRLYHSTAGAQSYHDWLETWLINMEPWADPEVSNDVPTLREQMGRGGQYYQTELAFEWSEDRAIILDQLSQYAASYCDWYRIGYHECAHDDDDAEPCSWDEQRENGTAPDHIKDMSPA